ncbi:MAG: hypothetical protein KBE53_14670 [Chromatiaceae bacterium]|nr:hypothetical protein [Chromatiaceae bacterium]
MPPPPLATHLALVLLVAVLTLVGCSTVTIAYNQADFFVKAYAKDYLDLEPVQVAGWEPMLTRELARHRAEELPYLAAYADQVLRASRLGLDEGNMTCLIASSRDLYQRQARFVVNLATPLLAGLSPAQIKSLDQRFKEEAGEDLAELAEGGGSAERERQTRRLVDAIEDWTGPLASGQEALVAEAMGRMPETRRLYLDYRGRQRRDLIALLEAKAGEARISAFLTDWLVDWREMPLSLDQARGAMDVAITELFIRLAASLDQTQRDRLDRRLRDLRDDLMELQRQPRMATLSC